MYPSLWYLTQLLFSSCFHFRCQCTEEGTAHAIIFWWDCSLSAEDETITINSAIPPQSLNPLPPGLSSISQSNHWQQSVFVLPVCIL
jgi:hypothetical protein